DWSSDVCSSDLSIIFCKLPFTKIDTITIPILKQFIDSSMSLFFSEKHIFIFLHIHIIHSALIIITYNYLQRHSSSVPKNNNFFDELRVYSKSYALSFKR